MDSYDVKCDVMLYTVTELFTRCTCSFYSNYCLLCSQVFSVRELQSVLHCDSALLDAISKRWKKGTLNTTSRVLPSSSQPCIKKQQIVKKVMYEQEKYLQARKDTGSLHDFLTTCGVNDFAQKLHQISLLLSLWQQNKDVIISDAKGAAVANVDTSRNVEGEHNNYTTEFVMTQYQKMRSVIKISFKMT